MGQGVSREQIARAKEIGIEEYILSREPNNVKRKGREYRLRDHDSLTISNGMWYWHSRGIGGKNVIDYLIFVRGYCFVDAVRSLAGDEITAARPVAPKARPPTEKKQSEREPLRLPPRNADNKRVIAYLQGRGIYNRELIDDCIKRGSLYENAVYHNAVFVGRDESGKARFAAMRGTNGDFKRDADGSDKRFGFCLPPRNPASPAVAVFESPIDALSHVIAEPRFDGWRLSLGGTALAALTRFLEQHPEISDCVVCTDNDEAGELAAAKIYELADELGVVVTRSYPSVGKDWNETLMYTQSEVKFLEDKRKDIVFRDRDYNEKFRIKDGESIKVTLGYDGEVVTRKCRWIDECHTKIGSEYYHNDEYAEKSAKAGNLTEPVTSAKPKIDVLAARYGEDLQDVEIPMTDAAIKRLVGGKYEVEMLYYPNRTEQFKDRIVEIKGKAFGAVVRGKDGIAVCGLTDGVLTSLHPYNAQTQKRELSPAERPSTPEKADFLGKMGKFKEKAAAQPPKAANPDKARDSAAL
jgi:hypothetical protein